MAAAHMVGAQAEAMKNAAANQGAGPAMAFMRMNMAQNMGGMNAQNLFQMGNQAQPGPYQSAPGGGFGGPAQQTLNTAPAQETVPPAGAWKCSCGAVVTGKFCTECGARKPESNPEGWVCACGSVNKGKFCPECGAKKPAGVPQYRCDKCGWEPADPTHPPKFCPECGDPFDDGDIK